MTNVYFDFSKTTRQDRLPVPVVYRLRVLQKSSFGFLAEVKQSDRS